MPDWQRDFEFLHTMSDTKMGYPAMKMMRCLFFCLWQGMGQHRLRVVTVYKICCLFKYLMVFKRMLKQGFKFNGVMLQFFFFLCAVMNKFM